MTLLAKVVPPNLALATNEYERAYQDQLNNMLRLYFNRINDSLNAVIGVAGARHLSAPYAVGQRTTGLLLTADTPTLIALDQTVASNGVASSATGGLSVAYSGQYGVHCTVQLQNTDAQAQPAWFWFRRNGVDVPGSGGRFDVPSSVGGVDGRLVAVVDGSISLAAGDSIEFWGAVGNAAVTLVTTGAQTSPFAMPAIPSVVATLTFVSES